MWVCLLQLCSTLYQLGRFCLQVIVFLSKLYQSKQNLFPDRKRKDKERSKLIILIWFSISWILLRSCFLYSWTSIVDQINFNVSLLPRTFRTISTYREKLGQCCPVLYLFSMTTITNYDKLIGLKLQKFILS